jgi:proteic killer suppression protein
MIKSFGSKETLKIWNGERSERLPFEIQASENINDLRIPPANRLEKLSGSEFHSIRINDQWRIIFKWINGSAEEVEIVDYH